MRLGRAALLGTALAAATGAPAQEPAPPQPRPALLAPLAARSILLGIARAGEAFVAVGDRGHILRSANGTEWTQVPSPANAMLNRVRFRDPQHGWAVGHDATILKTGDGGQSWAVQHYDPASRPLHDLAFLPGGRLIAVGGYGTYLASADDGATWQARTLPITDLGQHFNAITQLADGVLLIAGERGLLARSRDLGDHWDLLDSPYSGSFFGALPHGAKGAVAFGLRGNIWVSDDVARTPSVDPAGYDAFTRETVTDAGQLARLGWRLIPAPTRESLFGGVVDGASLLLVGVNGAAVRVQPGAGAAQAVTTPATETLADLLRDPGSESGAGGPRWIGVGRRGVQTLGEMQ